MGEPAKVIQLKPRRSNIYWLDAAIEIARWHLDNFDRFWALSRPTAKLYRFPDKTHAKSRS